MFAQHSPRDFAPRCDGPAVAAGARPAPITPTLHVDAGQILFHEHEPRGAIYRVEQGALCHYIRRDDGQHELIEFAFPGDIIGYGSMPERLTSAQAVTATVVSLISDDAFEQALQTDPRLAMRVAVAADREFEAVKARALPTKNMPPLARVAAYVSAVATIRSPDARPLVYADDVTSHFARDALALSSQQIQSALEAMAEQHLLAPTSEGWEICDKDALESL